MFLNRASILAQVAAVVLSTAAVCPALRAATVIAGFNFDQGYQGSQVAGTTPPYIATQKPLAGQPGVVQWPWITDWEQRSASANKTQVISYANANTLLDTWPSPPVSGAGKAPDATPGGSTAVANDGLVMISNSSSMLMRGFQETTTGTIQASYHVYFNNDIVTSFQTQPIEFALILSSQAADGTGNVPFGASVGIRQFGNGKNATYEWGYFDPNQGNQGSWVKFASNSNVIEEGWQTLTLTVNMDASPQPTYSAAVTTAGGTSMSMNNTIYGNSGATNDNVLRSVGFNRVSGGSGEYLFIDELSFSGIAPEPETWVLLSGFLASGFIPILIRFRKKQKHAAAD